MPPAKYAIVVGDGMADYPVDELEGKTPLMVAKKPNLDWLARHGQMGLVKTIPAGYPPGSEIANLSIMGYDPAIYFTGRGPIEAASLGVSLESDDIAFRCNLVTLRSEGSRTVMEDFSAGHITDKEAGEIIAYLNKNVGDDSFRFYAGISYRHLMVWKAGKAKYNRVGHLRLVPPHDITGKEISPYLPKAEGRSECGEHEILNLMKWSQEVLKDHPINVARRKRSLPVANSIWLWGQGQMPVMPSLKKRFGIEGSVVAAVDLIKGIGILSGLEPMNVPGATGYFDTNYDGKASCALDVLRNKDFVYVHVEAPDEAGHMGDYRKKIECIEIFDQKIVGPILRGLKVFGRYRLLVLPDHPTPVSLRTHTGEPVPYVLFGSDEGFGDTKSAVFDENSAALTGNYFEKGHDLITHLIG